jgi:hypothetical protein
LVSWRKKIESFETSGPALQWTREDKRAACLVLPRPDESLAAIDRRLAGG